ncbi:MAG TPA: MBOAT family protein [Solirubrobacteraceae bacterium]|jgi:D-alanyl-lipoteichoic acid acyltransferase DltB (MBOAT superfamily)|nr:MBOAT family protein [Solirubrobacteraceae bacterium]
MLFPTVEFAIFFPAVLALSWALMSRPALWKPFIVAVSYLFYASANWKFVFLIAVVTAGNQLAAVLIHRSDDERRRKWIMAGGVALDLAVLGTFKYYAFFVTDINRVLEATSLGLPLPLLTIALPVGVSFFTFQAISYVVDVRRRLIEPSPLVDVAIYLSFFPHLIAGPIVRAREFLPQLQTPRDPRDIPAGAAMWLIAIGLVKKVAIADYLAREVADPVFAVPEAHSGADVVFATYAYAAQIYCDFSGYTDMAIGLALLMGFVFPNNFDRPYRAASFREFWRRWHITLSRFLRDFLYIPFGGSRHGKLRTVRNLMATMLLGGLWHGAAWTFVIWGGIHGAAQAVEHLLRGKVHVPRWLGWLLTFHIVCAAWVLFRSPDLGVAADVFAQMTAGGEATLITAPALVLVLAVIGLQLIPPRPMDAIQLRVQQWSPAALGAAMFLVILLVGATIPDQGVPPFIYFQF